MYSLSYLKRNAFTPEIPMPPNLPTHLYDPISYSALSQSIKLRALKARECVRLALLIVALRSRAKTNRSSIITTLKTGIAWSRAYLCALEAVELAFVVGVVTADLSAFEAGEGVGLAFGQELQEIGTSPLCGMRRLVFLSEGCGWIESNVWC
jgi:hypothetical protein